MRKMRIMEHISLDSVIQQSADENDFPYGAWTAPYRPPAGRDATPPRSFEFVSTKALASGVIINTYRPDGPLRTGTMGA
jgi:hypothetical protein